jgi:DNA anti-recombination protein RmuC
MNTNRIDLWLFATLLAAVTGGMLALGCERRDEPTDVAAAPIREEARDSRIDTDYMKRQLAELERSGDAAQRDAKRDIDQARDKVQELPEETRQELSEAIARAESARDNLSDRLDELKEATDERWEDTRQRFSDALSELAEARREVAAAMRGERTEG